MALFRCGLGAAGSDYVNGTWYCTNVIGLQFPGGKINSTQTERSVGTVDENGIFNPTNFTQSRTWPDSAGNPSAVTVEWTGAARWQPNARSAEAKFFVDGIEVDQDAWRKRIDEINAEVERINAEYNKNNPS